MQLPSKLLDGTPVFTVEPYCLHVSCFTLFKAVWCWPALSLVRRSAKRVVIAEPRERDRIDADPDDRAGRSDRRERPAAPEQPHTGILKMRGLPFSATADEIVQWFGDSAPEITSDRQEELAHVH